MSIWRQPGAATMRSSTSLVKTTAKHASRVRNVVGDPATTPSTVETAWLTVAARVDRTVSMAMRSAQQLEDGELSPR